MRNLVGLIALTAAAAASGCSHNRATIPTDLEPLYHFMQYHGPDCHSFPYSCPPCPYFDYQNCIWRDRLTGMPLALQ